MDFSTMKMKIKQDDYSNIVEFRSDFELMCDNAMKYNRPETIYWQAAKKLLATGSKLMNKDKLVSSRRSVECFARLTERELGFRIDSSHHSFDEHSSSINESLDTSTTDHESLSSMSLSQACSQRKPKLILKLPKFYEKPPTVITDEEEEQHHHQLPSEQLQHHPDDEDDDVDDEEEEDDEFTPEELLAHAQHAAQCARQKLLARHPIHSYTLAYQRDHGATSLCLVDQDDFTKQMLALREKHYLPPMISSALPVIQDKEQSHQLSAHDFLEHGPFSSHGSSSDSTFSSLPKDELDSLIHTYGSDFSAQYAVSLMDYVKDTGDLALAYVDRFLSVLTNGEHDNLMAKRREAQKITLDLPIKLEPEPGSEYHFVDSSFDGL